MSKAAVIVAGLASLLLLTWLTLLLFQRPIESDLERRATESLSVLDIADLRVEAQGRDLLLHGVLPPQVDAAEVGRLVGQVWGVRAVDIAALRERPLTVEAAQAVPVPLMRERIITLGGPVADPLDADACQRELARIAAGGTLRLAKGTATPDPGSYAVLNELAAAAFRCPRMRIVIGSHTDTRGDAQANLELSRLRAQAVAAFFRLAGIPGERLQPVGYGGARPVADDSIQAGRAVNRRITFAVIPMDGGP